MSGLIHPDSHFSGVKEGHLRKAAYKHLRMHAHVSNRLQIFEDVGPTRKFSINIYGCSKAPKFTHVSWLYSPETLRSSITHDGQGPLPGIKHNGKWDSRPHSDRLVQVDSARLTEWNRLSGENTIPDTEAPLLYPVTVREQGAISALSLFTTRLADYNVHLTQGYNETNAKKDGFIRWSTGDVDNINEVVLQGPHFLAGTPFAQNPKIPCKSPRDWRETPAHTLEIDYIPRTNYVRSCDLNRYQVTQDVWDDKCYTEHFRLAWRRMIDFDGNRSLFAALIPPGPSHVDAVNSMILADNRRTSLTAGFWAALPLDYLLRITDRSDLRVAEAQKMPAVDPAHPLASALLLRALRLNVLTSHYSALWEELYDPRWAGYEDWANPAWSCLNPLAAGLTATWEYNTPFRTEYERRAALVELDALVSVWLGITADQLVAIYKSRYPVLSDYESAMYFDANGRKIAGNHNTYGHDQTKQDYLDLVTHLESPTTTSPPTGYTAPFHKADREAEMRAAHAHFQARLDKEIAVGRWTPPERRQA
ncbi:hypothetical protein [Streptomyces sp. NPDC048187]|uniref:hypothetical protein n=1 Tax=Streptomyces sp. NPDC048187 TaxID=3365509 RepID=UPI0037102A24